MSKKDQNSECLLLRYLLIHQVGWRWVVLLFLTMYMIHHNLRVSSITDIADDRDISEVHAEKSTRETLTQVGTPSENPCSLGQFRSFYAPNHEFPGSGSWREKVNHTDFHPEMCRLRGQPFRGDSLAQCLQESNLTSMLLLGDSNVDRYLLSLMNILNNVPEEVTGPRKACLFGRSEQHLPKMINQSFYLTGRWPVDKTLRTTHRFCGRCGGRELNCKYLYGDTSVTLDVSRIPLTSIIDTSMSLEAPADLHKATYVHWAPTTQEYLLQFYLRGRYPDVIVFFVPFSHTKNVIKSVERAKADVEYFHSLAKLHLPKKTKLFYVTGPAEHEIGKPEFWKGRLFQGMLANEKIDKLNKMLYEVIEKDLLDTGGNVYGFFDLMKLGETRDAWTDDGVHMTKSWYDAIMTYFLEVVCNSVTYEDLKFGR